VVVSGEDGLDEVTLSGPTRVFEVRRAEVREFRWRPEEFGMQVADLKSLTVDGPAASAQMIREILAGVPGPPRDIVVLNAAAAIWTADAEATLQASAQRAAIAIDSRAAQTLLARLAELSHSV
jgi:anthranilate phosphoribosyltransferase